MIKHQDKILHRAYPRVPRLYPKSTHFYIQSTLLYSNLLSLYRTERNVRLPLPYIERKLNLYMNYFYVKISFFLYFTQIYPTLLPITAPRTCLSPLPFNYMQYIYNWHYIYIYICVCVSCIPVC